MSCLHGVYLNTVRPPSPSVLSFQTRASRHCGINAAASLTVGLERHHINILLGAYNDWQFAKPLGGAQIGMLHRRYGWQLVCYPILQRTIICSQQRVGWVNIQT